jgi:hypothetical protein
MQGRSWSWPLTCEMEKRFERGKCAMWVRGEDVGCPRIGLLSAKDLEN